MEGLKSSKLCNDLYIQLIYSYLYSKETLHYFLSISAVFTP